MEVCEAIISLVEVVGIETAPPINMQGYEIMDYYWSSKNTNETFVVLFPHDFTLKGLKMVIFSVCSNYVVPGPGQLAFGLNLLTAVIFSLS